MQTFTVVEVPALQFSDWVVLDGNGEERERTPYFTNAVRFAGLLITEEREAARRAAPIPNADPRYLSEAYRRGLSAAYSHAANRLSFLLAGTLPPREMLAQARLLVASLDQWGDENLDLANEYSLAIQEKRPVRPVPARPRPE